MNFLKYQSIAVVRPIYLKVDLSSAMANAVRSTKADEAKLLRETDSLKN